MPDIQAYASWLREQRESVRPELTQAALARMVGVSRTYIHLLEKGDDPASAGRVRKPDPEHIDAISRALEQFAGRPLVNEARRVLGYPQIQIEEPGEEVIREALLSRIAERARRLPATRLPLLETYLEQLERVRQPRRQPRGRVASGV